MRGAVEAEVKPGQMLRSWLTLVGLTILLTSALRLIHAPAAFMLGPLISGIVTALGVPGARLPPFATVVAQAMLGCLIAQTLAPDLLLSLLPRWPLLLGINLALVGGMMGIGLLITHRQWLPGTAGVWGVSPGAAAAMVMLSDAYGSDKRLVAVMQYLRILIAVLTVIAIGSIFGERHPPDGTIVIPGGTATPWTAPLDPVGLGIVVGLVLTTVGLAAWLKKPALAIFIPIIGGVAIQFADWGAPTVPPLAAAAAFGLIGWHVGLSFTRAALMHSIRMLPRILLMILAVLILCGLLALVLARIADVSLLTAYMALNPGGIDAVLILAASIDVDLPLILAIQMSRVVLTLAFLPMASRMVANHYLRDRHPPPTEDAAGKLADDVDAVL